MNHLQHLIIILCVIATACGSSDNQVSKDAKDTESDTVRTETDTMKIQPPSPSLSPGTARVQATIEKINVSDNKTYLVIQVNQLLRQGSSAPPLSTDQTVRVNATSYHQNDRRKFDSLKEGKHYILTVGHRQGLNQSNQWILQQISPDTSTNNSLD